MRELESNSIDSVVTDPPAGIGFMGRDWDKDRGGREVWVAWMTQVMEECLRVLKPGGHALVWALPRTSHWTAWAVESAGFEVRDVVHHLFGTGFPKSLDVSKAIDKAAGAERRVVGSKVGLPGYSLAPDKGRNVACVASGDSEKECQVTAPATDEARQWEGWGTALKPAAEHWILARKPLRGTVATNVLAYDTGGLNIDGCRIGHSGGGTHRNNRDEHGNCRGHRNGGRSTFGETFHGPESSGGRFPANVILSPAAAEELDRQSGHLKSGKMKAGTKCRNTIGYSGSLPGITNKETIGDAGGASRFFYIAKPSRRERNKGLPEGKQNAHPTVKSVKLMRYFIRLITPPNGVVLDPFMGSGSTGVAARDEGFSFLGFEAEEEFFSIAKERVGL